jgi:iron complex outermembrane receptor protein
MFLKKTDIAFFVLVSLGVGEPCAAADTTESTLDTVVVTGSRYEHSTFNLPASVDVIDAGHIGGAQARVNLSEALSSVSGVTALNRQNYAQDLQISSRGFGARSAFGIRGIRLIADGIPATMPDGQGQAATFDLDVADHIEVMRGPFASVYGNHAGGVIQMFSRSGEGSPTGAARFQAGSWGSHKADASVEGSEGPWSYLFDTSRFDTDGYRQHSATSRNQSFVKLVATPEEGNRITFVGGSLGQSDTQDPQGLIWVKAKSDPRSVATPALDFNTRKSIDHVQGGVTWEHRSGNDQFELLAYTGTRSVTQFQSVPVAAQLASNKNSGGVVDFDRRFGGTGARWTHINELGSDARLASTFGIDYDQSTDDRKGYENFIGAVLGVKGNLRRNEADAVRNVSPYAQVEWKSVPWTVTAGVRHSDVRFAVTDKFLSNGDDGGRLHYSATTPMLGVVYQVNPKLNAYLSAARGFETPTFNELFYSAGGQGFNFGLDAATSRHLEIGLKALPGRDTRVDVALFAIATENELVVDQSLGGRTSYRNAGSTVRRGIEMTIDSSFDRGFSARLSIAALRAIYDEAFLTKVGVGGSLVTKQVAVGARLPGTPNATAFGELAWTDPIRGINAALEVVARGRIYVEDSNSFAPAPGYGIANLRLSHEDTVVGWQVKEFARIDNLFNRAYIGSVIVSDNNNRYYEPAPDRNWLLGIEIRRGF